MQFVKGIVRGHPLGANILVIAFTFGCNEIGIARHALRYAVTHFNIICNGFFRLVIPGISEITGGTAGRASAAEATKVSMKAATKMILRIFFIS